jgi:hypothetical protein
VRRTCTMESNNGVGKVSVQSHSRSEGDWHVGEQTHAEGCQGGNGGSRGDEIALNLLDAQRIPGVFLTNGVAGEAGADACTTTV